MAVYQDPDMVALFETYTVGAPSVGADLTDVAVKGDANDPLVVTTGTDMAIFPGSGRPPSVQSFRLSTKGFKELAGVSHLGPAMGSILRIHELDPENDLWLRDAEKLLDAVQTARAANSEALWRDKIAVEAFAGREADIAAMLDYGCALTARYLKAVLADESKLTAEFLRNEVLEAKGDALGATVPFNWVMIATFFLTGLDTSHRIMNWFQSEGVDWRRAMVLVCGKAGRPTSGVTLSSNSIAQVLVAASGHALPLERLYIAPHGPSFVLSEPVDMDAVKSYEEPLRFLWSYTKAICDLAGVMFDGFPRYSADVAPPQTLTPETEALSEMPRIQGPDDMYTMTTRLRIVMEDPRQLLSGCVTDYAAEQLLAHGNDPSKVTVPGLDGVTYPTDL
jgi:hypothetical protein